MSIFFRSTGGPSSATTLAKPSAICVAEGELPDEFLSHLIVVFEFSADVEFSWAELPVKLRAATAIPPSIYCVSFAVIAPEVLPRWAMGHRSRLRRVEGPTAKIPEAGGAGCRSRAEARDGVHRVRSSSRKAPTRKMSGEPQAEIAVAAAAMTEGEQARARAFSLDDFKVALAEREKAFHRDAVAYLVFTDQVEYDGAGRAGDSDEGSEADDEGGCEEDAGYVGTTLNVTRAGELMDSSDEVGADAKCYSIGSFIDTGALPDDDTINSDGSASK